MTPQKGSPELVRCLSPSGAPYATTVTGTCCRRTRTAPHSKPFQPESPTKTKWDRKISFYSKLKMFPKFTHTATSEEASGTSDKQTSCSATSTPLPGSPALTGLARARDNGHHRTTANSTFPETPPPGQGLPSGGFLPAFILLASGTAHWVLFKSSDRQRHGWTKSMLCSVPRGLTLGQSRSRSPTPSCTVEALIPGCQVSDAHLRRVQITSTQI